MFTIGSFLGQCIYCFASIFDHAFIFVQLVAHTCRNATSRLRGWLITAFMHTECSLYNDKNQSIKKTTFIYTFKAMPTGQGLGLLFVSLESIHRGAPTNFALFVMFRPRHGFVLRFPRMARYLLNLCRTKGTLQRAECVGCQMPQHPLQWRACTSARRCVRRGL